VATDPQRQREEQYSIMPEGAPFEEGFNIKTLWACLFVGIVMLPGAIYLGLVTGQSMAGASEWVTIILFLEIAKRSFVRLRTQELIIIYWIAGSLVAVGGRLGTGAQTYGGPFGGLMWDQYLIQSPAAEGLSRFIPTWVVPPLTSQVYTERTFFHPDWIAPIAVMFTSMILGRAAWLSMGYVLFRVTNDIERLPFPMAPVHARGATALAETSSKQEGWRWRVFSTGTCIGLVWGLLYVVVPTLSGIFLTDTVQILPIPFIDFTAEVKSILPAALLGIGTDLGHLLIGFVLPFWVVVGSFFGATITQLFVNPMLYSAGILHRWSPGMTAIPAGISNRFDFWLSFTIGTAVVVFLTGVSMVVKSLREQRQKRASGEALPTRLEDLPQGRGDVRLAFALGIWALATLGFVVLCRILVPKFPWYIVTLFGFVYTPVMSYIGGRMIGLTGSPYGATIPYIREASFFLSGYRGTEVWFAPIPIADHGTAVGVYKQLELTRTKFGGLIKMHALTILILFVCSFVFWQFIWRLAPVPSSTYPFVQKFWPFESTMQTMWIKSTMDPKDVGGGAVGIALLREIIKPQYIFTGAAFGGLLYGVLAFFRAPTLLFYGFVSGLGAWPHFIIPQFAGAMLGRFYFQKRFGEARWHAYAPILLAGYSCGMGLIGMTSIAIALISKAISQVVF